MIKAYIKTPIELAELALRERQVSKAGVYLASQFIYSGKARIESETVSKIGTACNLKPRSVYSAFKWLINRDWMGKDSINGWYFFRGLNHIHKIEGWKYSRSALMFEKDLKTIRAFFIGVFLASVVKSGNSEAGTERLSRRSVRTPFPVSLSFIEKALKVSQKTAFNYRKDAEKYKYIKMIPNLKEVKLSVNDLRSIRANNPESIRVSLFGSPQSIQVQPKQLVIEKSKVKAQLPNLIFPNVLLKKRNLRRYQYRGLTTCGSC